MQESITCRRFRHRYLPVRTELLPKIMRQREFSELFLQLIRIFKVRRVQEYSFGIQREIGFDTAIEVRYVGTRSNNLAARL